MRKFEQDNFCFFACVLIIIISRKLCRPSGALGFIWFLPGGFHRRLFYIVPPGLLTHSAENRVGIAHLWPLDSRLRGNDNLEVVWASLTLRDIS